MTVNICIVSLLTLFNYIAFNNKVMCTYRFYSVLPAV